MSQPTATDRPGVTFGKRVADLGSTLAEKGFDAALITDPVNVRYLCGYWTILSRSSPEALVIRPDGDPVLVIPALEVEAARGMSPHLKDIRGWRQYAMPVGGTLAPPMPFAERVKDALPVAARQVGVERGHLSAEIVGQVEAPSRELVDITGLVAGMRVRKDPDELASLRQACRVVTAACRVMIEAIRPGVTEHHLAAVGAGTIYDAGGRFTHLVVGSGPRSAFPHPLPTQRQVRDGDLVLIDIGVEYDDYWAEIARTVIVGRPGDQVRQWFNLVREAQRAGAGALRAGATGGEVDLALRQTLAAAGYDGRNYIHSSGHGLGLLGADAPYIFPQGADVLATPSAISLEPGLYFPGTGGIRIEDAFFVTDNGVERWTDLPQELELQ